jgi:hypothetical protein
MAKLRLLNQLNITWTRKRRSLACVLLETGLAFAHKVKRLPTGLWAWNDEVIKHTTAIFRQINIEKITAHHDALKFPES